MMIGARFKSEPRPPRCEAREPNGSRCTAWAVDGKIVCEWHLNVPDDLMSEPERGTRYEFVCMTCASRTSSPWDEELTLAYGASGKLRCARCKGSVLLAPEDVGAISSPLKVRSNVSAWRHYSNRAAS